MWILEDAIFWSEFPNHAVRLHVYNKAHHRMMRLWILWPIHHIQLPTVNRCICHAKQTITDYATMELGMEGPIAGMKTLNASIFTIGHTQQTQIAGQCQCMRYGKEVSWCMLECMACAWKQEINNKCSTQYFLQDTSWNIQFVFVFALP